MPLEPWDENQRAGPAECHKLQPRVFANMSQTLKPAPSAV
jgi:hypothetical protein